MRLISWNLGAAYGPYIDRHEEAWRWLQAADPDVALLQETVPPAWAGEQWTLLHRPFELWASAIVAKPDIGVRPVELAGDSMLGRFGSYLATAQVEAADCASVLLASVHCRAKEAPAWVTAGHDRGAMARPGEADPWSNDVAFAGYRTLIGDGRFVIGGDWNTARYPEPDGTIKARNLAFFERAEAAGWHEVSLDPDGREGRTWFGGNPARSYQPDHVFTDRTTRTMLRSATIDPRPAELGLSDHAPIVVDLDMRVGDRKES